MITPADIENKVFAKAVRGYKEEEVDDFLDLIILDMEKLMKENRQLKKELEKSQTQVDRHVSTESSVYETLESAKSLLNDIAASAERRAQVILKDAELEAAKETYVYIDYKQAGIGSNSCGPELKEKYRFNENEFDFAFRIKPVFASSFAPFAEWKKQF